MKLLDDLQYHIYRNMKEHRTFKLLSDILCFLSWLETPNIFKYFLYDKCILCGKYTSMWDKGGIIFTSNADTKKCEKKVYCERCYYKKQSEKEESYKQKYADLFHELREMLYPETKEEFERVKEKYIGAMKYYDNHMFAGESKRDAKKSSVDYEIRYDELIQKK